MEQQTTPNKFNKNPTTQETIFNSAAASLERLHELLVDSNKHSRACFMEMEGDSARLGYNGECLIFWENTLKAIWREVSPKLTEAEMQKIQQEFDIIKNLPITETFHNYKGTSTRINIQNFNQNWEQLHKIEMNLRRLADARGMLLPLKVSNTEANEL